MIQNIQDVMTENVVTVTKETPLLKAALILSQHGFNALPVVDEGNHLLGLFTERNMVADRSYVHLKTILKLFSEMEFYKQDNSPIKEDLNNLMSIKVSEIMTTNPQTIKASDSIEQALNMLTDPKNNPLPVVDEANVLHGVVALSDVTRVYGVALKKSNLDETEMNRQVDQFIEKFEKQFLVVSRFRAHTWFIASILFALIGFAVAMFLILRIS